MAHRSPGVSSKWEETSSCVPLRTALCANPRDFQCWGPLLFLLMWGEGPFCFPFLLHPACAPQPAFHPPGKDLALSLGAILQGHLEERGEDFGDSPDPVPIATVWLIISG